MSPDPRQAGIFEPGNLTGLVLAGGRSSRFGRDKSRLRLDGVPLARRVADALAPCCAEVLLSTGRRRADAGDGWTAVPDHFPDAGPLAGTGSRAGPGPHRPPAGGAVRHAAPRRSDALRELLAQARPGEITLAGDGANRFPTLGIYPRSVQPALAEFLRGGGRKAWDFLDVGAGPLDRGAPAGARRGAAQPQHPRRLGETSTAKAQRARRGITLNAELRTLNAERKPLENGMFLFLVRFSACGVRRPTFGLPWRPSRLCGSIPEE